jgi:hypothetical protein
MNTGAETLASLKEAGYKVHVSHRRPVNYEIGSDTFVVREYLTRFQLDEDIKSGRIPAGAWFNHTGGETTVTIETERGAVVGRAICRRDEQFDRALGLTIAIGRAVKQAPWVLDPVWPGEVG